MLVLRRRLGDRLYIGENVTVEVLALSSGSVSLGVQAPRDIAVHREEAVDQRECVRTIFDRTPMPIGGE